MSSELYLKGKKCLEKGNAKKAEKIFLKAAGSGDQEAQVFLGSIYRYGNGVPKDEQSAYRWYKEGAERGNIAGLRGLGDCYAEGIGVTANETEAVRCYSSAVKYCDQESREKLLVIVNRFIDRIINEQEAGQDADAADDRQESSPKYLKERAVYWIGRTALEGSADAQLKLGKCLENGLCMNRNMEQAAYWYDRAAGQSEEAAKRFAVLREAYDIPADFSKDARILYERGSHHMEDREGLIMMDSYSRGAFLIERAAELGDAEAQYKTAQLYMIGKGVDKSVDKGVQWYEKAAEQGFANAQVALGGYYSKDTYGAKDPVKSAGWYKKAAEQGDPVGEFLYGAVLYDGGIVEKDDAQAFDLFMKSALKGNADGQLAMGICYNSGRGVQQDKEKAVYWYELAAKQNHSKAMYLLGCACMDKEEYERAAYWLRKAEEKGNRHASLQLGHAWFKSDENRKNAIEQYDKGSAYLDDDGEGQDKEKAVQCLKQAAELCHTDAQYLLAWCYERGEGTDKDDSKAAYWYEEAAKPRNKYLIYADKYKQYAGKDSGSEEFKTDAWMKTAESYIEGKGVKKNFVKAAYWLKQAEGRQNEDAARQLEKIRPLVWDLSEEAVEIIYEDCIAQEAYTEPDQCASVDLPEIERFGIHAETVSFDRNKIAGYSVYIRCMLGQLRSFHDDFLYPLSFADIDFKDYRGRAWTDEPRLVRKLYALGIASDSISRFYQLENGLYVARKNPFVDLTFHTTEPRFHEWFEKMYKPASQGTLFFRFYDSQVDNAAMAFSLPVNEKIDNTYYLLSRFWYQPSDVRKKLITISQECILTSDLLTEEKRRVYYKEISNFARMADKQDLLVCQFYIGHDDESVIYNDCYQYDPELQKTVNKLLQQGAEKKEIAAQLIHAVNLQHSQAMYEILKEARSISENEVSL